MYMYMSSWLTIGIHVHVPCRGSFGFTAGEADRWLPPLSCATRHVRDWTEPATLASHRPAKQHLPEGFSHPGSPTWPSESCRRKAIERRKQHPEPGLATAKHGSLTWPSESYRRKAIERGNSTRNPASPQQNSTYLKVKTAPT